MRPVEVLVISPTKRTILEFRSTRSAHQYIEDSVESHEDLHMIRSRVHVNNKLSENWMLVAADASCVKQFLIRIKPTQ